MSYNIIVNYMKNFINLTSRVINKLHIIEIIKTPNNYTIRMSNSDLNGFLVCGTGSIGSNSNFIEINEKDNKQDYDTITNLLNTHFKNTK